MSEANYTKPTDQLALEAQQKEGYVPNGVLTLGETPPLSDNGYVNVDPVYQNYANETEKPMQAEEGVHQKLEETLYADEVDNTKGATPEGVEDAEFDEEEEEEENPPATPTSPVTQNPFPS